MASRKLSDLKTAIIIKGLVDWVQKQPLAEIFSCLGDGHDGIWNLFAAIAPSEQRFEILLVSFERSRFLALSGIAIMLLKF
ncbi:MAG TPA: hypothetical protein DCZ88_05370 [Pseudanabaena sp.]|nr:hypothetical protein [Pseudanabaena sp.]